MRRDHVVRPHISAILELRHRFVLGVYSSATMRTVQTAMARIRSELMRLKREEGLQDGARGAPARRPAAWRRRRTSGCCGNRGLHQLQPAPPDCLTVAPPRISPFAPCSAGRAPV